MSSILRFAWLMCLWSSLFFLAAPSVQAMPESAEASGAVEPHVPASALLSPQGARIEVSAETELAQGETCACFYLPAGAENLQLEIPGRTIASWSVQELPLRHTGRLSARRQELRSARERVAAALESVTARLTLLQAPGDRLSNQEMQQRSQMIAAELPGLARERQALERELATSDRVLATLPPEVGLGSRVSVFLEKGAANGARLPLRYSYILGGCGWQPFYDFNARTGGDGQDQIDVRLLADVWQFSGMDWNNTAITLATLGMGPRQPAPLARWTVESRPRPQPREMPVALNAVRSSKAASGAAAMAEGSADHAAPVADTGGVYASWRLASPGLPEGRSRLLIFADTWQAPLQWIARPGSGDGRVWLLARCRLPQAQAWPDGAAQFSVAGQSVGQGSFKAEGGEATLYFGADPRVNIRVIADARKKGQSGLINNINTWTWAWTYVLANGHDRPVTVRVERPAPMIVDEGVKVSYKNNPPAQEDAQKHMIYWLVEIPAHGSASIAHELSISAPASLNLSPVAP